MSRKRRCRKCGGKMKFHSISIFLVMKVRNYKCTQCEYMEWQSTRDAFREEKEDVRDEDLR